jgi:intracellular multiplication protein IcmC
MVMARNLSEVTTMLPYYLRTIAVKIGLLLSICMLSFAPLAYAAQDQTSPQSASSTDSVVPSYAVTPYPQLSASDVIAKIVTQIPNLMRLITAIAYVTGMYFVFHGILLLKQYGEQRTQMSGQHHLKGPMIFIVIGTCLLYLPSSVQVGMSTFWTQPNPYGYMQQQDQWSKLFSNIFMVIQLFGVLAFIRGLILLSHLGGHGGQPGTFAKGMTHIIGGILCINMYQFVQVVMVTLGIQSIIGG